MRNSAGYRINLKFNFPMNEDHLTVNLETEAIPLTSVADLSDHKLQNRYPRMDGRKAVILIDQGVVEEIPNFVRIFYPCRLHPARRDFQIGFGSGEGVGFFGHQPDRSVKLSFRDWRRSDGRPGGFAAASFFVELPFIRFRRLCLPWSTVPWVERLELICQVAKFGRFLPSAHRSFHRFGSFEVCLKRVLGGYGGGHQVWYAWEPSLV